MELAETCYGTGTNSWVCKPPPPSAQDEKGAYMSFHFNAWDNSAYKRCTEKAYWRASLDVYDFPGERIECCQDCHRIDSDWPPS